MLVLFGGVVDGTLVLISQASSPTLQGTGAEMSRRAAGYGNDILARGPQTMLYLCLWLLYGDSPKLFKIIASDHQGQSRLRIQGFAI